MTLELLRRIEQTSTLLIATYRDDEVGDRHPLRLVLGDLATMSARPCSAQYELSY